MKCTKSNVVLLILCFPVEYLWGSPPPEWPAWGTIASGWSFPLTRNVNTRWLIHWLMFFLCDILCSLPQFCQFSFKSSNDRWLSHLTSPVYFLLQRITWMLCYESMMMHSVSFCVDFRPARVPVHQLAFTVAHHYLDDSYYTKKKHSFLRFTVN